MKNRKPVSRIDSDDTHGHFARVYRDDWVRGKMFSDAVYGSAESAERAAWDWHRRVDRCLPTIPPKPVLKVARFKLRKDKKGRFYDVYLPKPGLGIKPQSRKFHFTRLENMEMQARKAHDLVTARNAQLVAAHRLSMAAWKRKRDKIMQKIVKMWPDVKEGIKL